jgi:SPP1 gp7 family putative phage head morphogenesis protein
MSFTFKEALDFAQRKKVKLPDEYYGKLQATERSRAFSIAGVASREQLQDVLDSLNSVLRKGVSFDEWKKSATVQDLDLPGYRLDNIFRTNMQAAYNAGHWTQQQETKARRPYLMYDAINDSRVRPSHLELDNVVKPIDDPFWNTYYPPNGFQCRCSTISLTEAQAKARGGTTKDPDGGWKAPDKGWDYNPGANMDEGISKSVAPTPRGDSSIQRAMERRVSEQRSNLTQLEEAKAKGRPVTIDELKKWVFRDSSIPAAITRTMAKVFRDFEEWDHRVFGKPVNSLRVSDAKSMTSVGGRAAAGQYHMMTGNMRINADVASTAWGHRTIIHELGHHLDATMFGTQRVPANFRVRLLEEYRTALELLKKKGISADRLQSMPATLAHISLMDARVKAPSLYSLTNEHEWIAECFTSYCRTPEKLKVIAPKAFAAFEELKNGRIVQ